MLSDSVKSGQRVETLRFGPATIVKVTRTGVVVALDRMGKLPVEITLDQLVSNGASKSGSQLSVGEPQPLAEACAGRSEEAPQRYRARRAVEALRFGIVPVDAIREVTIDFAKLEAWVKCRLPDQRGGGSEVSEVAGPFGTGKSHTMAAIRLIARDHRYVTASVEVDGDGVSLSDPEGVLRQLWPTTTATDLECPTPIVDLNLRALDGARTQTLFALGAYERVSSNLQAVETLRNYGCLDRNVEEMEDFLGSGDANTASQLQTKLWLDLSREGAHWQSDQCKPKRLIGLRLEERPRDFVNSLLGYAVLANRAGFTGLVITIDEFEIEHRLSPARERRLNQLIDAMAEGLGSEIRAPLSIFIATVGQEGHEGDDIVAELVSASRGETYVLREWTRASMRQLARKISTLYEQAYGVADAFDAKLMAATERALDDEDVADSGLVRAFIKRYVAALDTAYGPLAS